MILSKATFGDENQYKTLKVLHLEAENNKKLRATTTHINEILKDIENSNLKKKTKIRILRLLKEEMKGIYSKKFEASIASRIDNFISAKIRNITK